MKCGACGGVLKVRYQMYSDHRLWENILVMLSSRHICPIKNHIGYNCIVCKMPISSSGITIHLVNCLNKLIVVSLRVDYIKIGNINGVDKQAPLSLIFNKFPQLLVVSGLESIQVDSEDGEIDEIIAKKIKTMSFHCLICGINYETFPANSVLLVHIGATHLAPSEPSLTVPYSPSRLDQFTNLIRELDKTACPDD